MKKFIAAALVAAMVVGLVPPEAGAVARTDGGRLWTPGSGPTLLSLPEAGLPPTKADLLKERGAGDGCRRICERKKYGFDPDSVVCYDDCPYESSKTQVQDGAGGSSRSSSDSNTAIIILLGVLLVVVLIAAVAASKPKKNDDWMRR